MKGLLTVKEFQLKYGFNSLQAVYYHVNEGNIETVEKLGRILIPVSANREFLKRFKK